MSDLTERRIYRPKLFIRKNDKFSPFNFHFLLNLFDIEYQLKNDEQFPDVWRPTFDKTNVTVNVTTVNPTEETRTSSLEVNGGEDEPRSLLDILKMICREEKYDEDHASVWEKAFQDEQIYTIDQLCNISDDSWTHLKKISEVVKRLIIDYVKLNLDKVSNSFNQQSRDPHQDSKATLLADIDRVRRYFYNVIKKIDLISYLSRDAVDLAIEEVKKSYDDDGNILLNIQNCLRTFCLENRFEDEEAQERKKEIWRQHLDYFQTEQEGDNQHCSHKYNISFNKITLKSNKQSLELTIDRCSEQVKEQVNYFLKHLNDTDHQLKE